MLPLPLISAENRTVIIELYGAFQPHLDQMQHASINNPARYRFL
jgi:hypothetical protein